MHVPRILFITARENDFLADSLLHGLRCVLGSAVVDYPRCRYLDASLDHGSKSSMHGKGFTLYGRRPDAEGDAVDRERVWERAADGEFDLVVFSSIWRQYRHLIEHREVLRRCRTVLVDGEDRAMFFPWSGTVARRGVRDLLLAFSAARGMARLSRERPDCWFPQSAMSKPWTVISHAIGTAAMAVAPPLPIAFSIPEELVVAEVPLKDRAMFDHVVDPQTASAFPGTSTGHRYSCEHSYFHGLRRSKFAITRKRAGWECLRHYEIAASGCVPCFRFLDRKPALCAPFGLDSSNCLVYSDPRSLIDRIERMGDVEYLSLARNAIRWARANTTRARASAFLATFGFGCSDRLGRAEYRL